MVSAVNKRDLRLLAPELDLALKPCSVHPRIIALIEKGIIDSTAAIRNANRETSVSTDVDFDYPENQCNSYENIENQLNELEAWIDDVAGTLNHFFYQSLQREYDYQTSDDTVRESIEANECEFTEDGKPAYKIRRYADQSK